MTSSGDSTRQRIEILDAAEPEEAAAIVAAVERFLTDTTPPAQPARSVNPWQRAALLDGVRAKEAFASPWGEPRAWGERYSAVPGGPE